MLLFGLFLANWIPGFYFSDRLTSLDGPPTGFSICLWPGTVASSVSDVIILPGALAPLENEMSSSSSPCDGSSSTSSSCSTSSYDCSSPCSTSSCSCSSSTSSSSTCIPSSSSGD